MPLSNHKRWRRALEDVAPAMSSAEAERQKGTARATALRNEAELVTDPGLREATIEAANKLGAAAVDHANKAATSIEDAAMGDVKKLCPSPVTHGSFTAAFDGETGDLHVVASQGGSAVETVTLTPKQAIALKDWLVKHMTDDV